MESKLRGLGIKFTLLMVTTIGSLLVCEFLVRWFQPQDLNGTCLGYVEGGLSVNKAGGSARHQFKRRVVVYRFNEYHLRGEPIGPGRNRVLCVGDSCTFGWLVDEQYTYVRRLGVLAEAACAPGTFEFLNGGTGGWGTADYVAYVEDFGPSLKPQVVVAFLDFDDARRSIASNLYSLDLKNGLLHRNYYSLTFSQKAKQFARDLPAYQWLLEHSHLLQVFRHAMAKLPSTKSQTVSPLSPTDNEGLGNGLRLEHSLFLRLNEWCRAHDAHFLVVGIDCFFQPRTGEASEQVNAAFLAQARDFFERAGIPYRDLALDYSPSVDGDLASNSIPGDSHLNERGHELVAQLTWKWLGPQLRTLYCPQKAQGGAGSVRTPEQLNRHLFLEINCYLPASICL